MKNIDLGQGISIAANLGVIAGIVFLGVELNQNNRLLEAQAQYSLLENRTSFGYALLQNPELAEFLVRARDDGDLSEVDVVRLYSRASNLILEWEWNYLQFRDRNLANSDALIVGMRGVFLRPESIFVPRERFYGVWRGMRDRLSPEFVDFVESNIPEARIVADE